MAVETFHPTKSGSRLRVRASERRQYRVILASTFLFFLTAALIARVLPKSWQPASDAAASGHRSILVEARALADSVLPFAFMS